MKNKENKNKNKTKQKHKNKNSTSLWITVILSLIAFVLFGISYYYKSATFLSILIIIFCILGILASIWLLASTICNMLKTLINEYKAKQSVFRCVINFSSVGFNCNFYRKFRQYFGQRKL